MTIFAAVHEGGPDTADINRMNWQPWVNCNDGDKDILSGMIAHRHIRDRGGVLPGEILNLGVYIRDRKEIAAVVNFTYYKIQKG